jgi:hypothetical protein
MNTAYTWDSYVYAVSDCLLHGGQTPINNLDADILTHCYNVGYDEVNAAKAVMLDREERARNA